MKTLPLISVIVPVYNLEKYISDCLDSILSQNFKNFEIICVNDGSKDSSLAILRNYRKLDRRVKIIDNEHRGSAISCNIALQYALGKYIAFVDGNDALKNEALYELAKKAEEKNADIVLFGGFLRCSENKKIKKYTMKYDYRQIPRKYFNRVFSCEDIRKDIAKMPETAWTKLYKTKFLEDNNIKFQDTNINQDQLFFFHSMISAKRITVLEKNIYCCGKNHKENITKEMGEECYSPVHVFYSIENLLKRKNLIDKYESVFINKYFTRATTWLDKIDTDKKPAYFLKYIKLLNHIKTTYSKGWWMHFSPNLTDSLFLLKAKIYAAKTVKHLKYFKKSKCETQKYKSLDELFKTSGGHKARNLDMIQQRILL